MAAPYSLKIITPQGIAYEGTVVHTFLPTESGFVGILAQSRAVSGVFQRREKWS